MPTKRNIMKVRIGILILSVCSYILITLYTPIELTRVILYYLSHRTEVQLDLAEYRWEIILIWLTYLIGVLLFGYVFWNWIRRTK
jgi:hypothetical protein